MARHSFFAVSWLLCVLSRNAAAESPPPAAQRAESQELRQRAGSFSVAALGGLNYGDESGARSNAVLLGYGGRAGYSFEATALYLGVTVVGYEGEVEYDDTAELGSELYINVAIDIGAELMAGPLILRPYLGVGAQLGIYDSPSGGNSAIFPQLSPGFLARYPLGALDLGVDARLELGGSRTLSTLGSVGVAF